MTNKECKTCGHNCHCGKDCPKCANDVCYDCKCDDSNSK